MDYFTMFGLACSYSIDPKQLTYRYQELQRQYHPDRCVYQPESKHVYAFQQSATVNAAYQILKHPIKRAEYILKLYGIDINNEKHIMHDKAFLIEQLALREEIECIESNMQSEETLALFSVFLAKKIKRHFQIMEKQLHDKQLINAAETVRKLHFFDKLQQRVVLLEDRFFESFIE